MQRKQIYREEALQRISSPDQLNGYIRSSGTAVWFVLGAILLVLIGILVWGLTGSFEITLETKGGTYDGYTACFLDAAERESVEPGMAIRYQTSGVGVTTGIIASIDDKPIRYAEACDLLSTGLVNRIGLTSNGEYYKAELILDKKQIDGFAIVKIIRKRISPMDLLFNLNNVEESDNEAE